MECKFLILSISSFGCIELIDTLWNVNMIGTLSPDMGHTELIDTLWNVNVINSWLLKWKSNELIDTLWNVNKEETNTEENKTEN